MLAYHGSPAFATPRPASPLVLGIISILMAVAAILVHGLNLVMMLVDSPWYRQATGDQGAWGYIDSSCALLVWLTALTGCIGLLARSDRARRGMLKWAWIYLAWLAVCLVIEVLHQVPHTIAQAPPGASGGAPLAYAIAVAFALIVAVYPALTLFLLARPNVEAWFKQAGSSR